MVFQPFFEGTDPKEIISWSQIRGGTLFAERLVIGGGVQGVIQSENFDPTGETGWAIFGDGTAYFLGDVTLGEDAIVTGDVYSSNWNGAIPANLATRDATATAGFYLDSSVGSLQIEGNMWIGDGGVIEFLTGTVLRAGPDDEARAELTQGGLFFRDASDVVQGRFQDEGGAIGPILRLGNGADTTPSLTFEDDPNTGIYRLGADALSISLGGNSSYEFRVGSLRAPDGASNAPVYTFLSDTNTGFYSAAADTIGVAITGGGRYFFVDDTLGWSFGTNIDPFASGFTDVVGAAMSTDGILYATRDAATPVFFGRADSPAGGIVVDFRRNGTQVGTITVSAGATAYNVASDRVLKTDIKDLDGALDKVMALRPRRFRWKEDSREDVGVIAQEAVKVYPEMITAPGEVDFYMADYSKLSPLLLGAIQELEARVAQLEKAQ